MLYNKTYEILTITRTPDGKGGYDETTSVASTCRGLLVPVSGFESLRYGKEVGEITNRLYCKSETVVLRSNRIREKDATDLYEVINITDAALGLNKHKEVELKRIIHE